MNYEPIFHVILTGLLAVLFYMLFASMAGEIQLYGVVGSFFLGGSLRILFYFVELRR